MNEYYKPARVSSSLPILVQHCTRCNFTTGWFLARIEPRTQKFVPTTSSSSRPRDSQKQKLYNWEPRGLDRPIPREEVEALVATIATDYGIKQPRITYQKKRRGSRIASAYGTYRIDFTPEGLNKETTVHKMAHILCNNLRFEKREASHRPTFVAVFLLLLERYIPEKYNANTLAASATDHRLRVHPLGETEDMLTAQLLQTAAIAAQKEAK